MKYLVLLALLNLGCKRDETFPDIGDKFANPIDVAADTSGNFFFVLNTDYPRDYNAGSIMTFDRDGNKLNALKVKRLGRSLNVAGNDMIVTYSSEGEDASPLVELYDVTKPSSPILSASWVPTNCNPVNAEIKSGYKYFAISCSNGALQIGELTTPRSNSKLNYVRKYPMARRAMHLDVKRQILISFPTYLGVANSSDQLITDETSFTTDYVSNTETKVPNEVPDDWEKSINDRKNKGRRAPYQFTLYDIAAEAAKGFPLVEDIEVLQPELRWIYFNLANFDGTPDIQPAASTLTTRYYRTNFWDARADLNDENTFYLSHRGATDSTRAGSIHANSIVKVKILKDPKTANGVVPKTEDIMTFERVYGFKGEGANDSSRHYPGDFEMAAVNGSPLLMVNHFRDPVFFPSSQYSALAAKVLGDNTWFNEIIEPKTGHQYYQFALTSSGRAMAVSFYQNMLILLDTTPGAAITEIKTIN
jgi:hypothetical protein